MALGVDHASPFPGAAVVGMASLAVFGAGLAAMHLLQPGLNPRHRYISEYVLGDTGFIMTIAFAGLAAGCVATAWAFRHAIPRSRATSTGTTLLAMAGVAMLVTAIFPTDRAGEPATAVGLLHVAGAMGFLMLALPAALLIAWGLPVWTAYRRRTWLLALLVVVACGAFVLGSYFVIEVGIVQRLVFLSVWLWMFVAARDLRASGSAGLYRLSSSRGENR